MYIITDYTKNQAKRLGLNVKLSTNKTKKIDVYKNDKKIASIGANGYGDYPTFLKSDGKEFADKRRALYKLRHNKDRKVKGSNGFLADNLLW